MRVRALWVKIVVGFFSILLLGATAGAAGFPERPLQILCGWGVGSPPDLQSRAIAKPLSRILKQPVVVQNVPGGGGALVLGRVKTEKPDGYTLFQTGLAMYSQTPFTRVVPYDPLKDFAYLVQFARIQHYLLCRSDSPWTKFEELIQYVKNNPKTIRYGSPGVGSPAHILLEYIASRENLQWIHIPFNISAESVIAILGGHLELAAISVSDLEHVKTGRLRVLLGLNEKRLAMLPDIPTVMEKGYDFYCTNSFTLTVPAATPRDIQKTLEKALMQAMADPEAINTTNKLNNPYDPLDSEATTKAVIKDHQKYGELMKKFGQGIYKK